MVSLEQKILGEKPENYCSSSEDEDTAEDKNIANEKSRDGLHEKRPWEGLSANTGPKGVIEDWRRYKQLEAEKRQEQDAEQLALIKKLSLTCSSHLEDEKRNTGPSHSESDDIYRELEEMEDDFMLEYRKRRMQEMIDMMQTLPTFARIIELQSGGEFLDAIDKENKNVTILVHLYELPSKACESMSGCLTCLAAEYINVKFCQLQASSTKLSKNFLKSGVPALLVYRGGELIASFVQMFREFGDDFFATDVEGFLVEHGVLPDKTLIPKLIRDSAGGREEDDSDYDVD